MDLPDIRNTHTRARDARDIQGCVNGWLARTSPATNQTYAKAIIRAARVLPGGLLWRAGRAEVVDAVRALQETYEDSTVALTVRAMSSLWDHLQAEGAVARNPWRGMEPKVRRTLERRILSEEEVRALVEHAGSQRNKTFVRFLYGTGLRISEAASAKWEDLRCMPGRGEDDPPRWLLSVFGKGGKSRVVVVPLPVFAALVHLRGPGRQPKDRLFPFSPRRGEAIVTQIRKRAGMDKAISPHWLRHAFASHALDRGAPISLVQQSMGHSRLDTTGVYLEVQPGQTPADWLPEV